MLPRASSFASGATESSRSMKTSSAGSPGALDSIFGDEPGTERQERRGLTTRSLMRRVPPQTGSRPMLAEAGAARRVEFEVDTPNTYMPKEDTMGLQELEAIARALVAPGKGILAADESTGTIKKRFDSIGVESTEENRRAYREMLFTTPGMEEFISGVIMFDETIRQSTADGVAFTKVLEGVGVIPGIKVDAGAKPLAGFPEETVTEGLDGLRERLAEYRELGARFAKWRAVMTVGPGIPTQTCIDSNAEALARFAALSQE